LVYEPNLFGEQLNNELYSDRTTQDAFVHAVNQLAKYFIPPR
jgi:hypothetical protein